MRLRRVGHQRRADAVGDPLQGRQIGGLPEQVHRRERARAQADRVGGRGGIEGEDLGVDVGQHRHAAGEHHRGGGGEEGERRHDHLVAGHQQHA